MRIKLTWRGESGRSSVLRKTDFVKDEFVTQSYFAYSSNTELVRFLMNYFKEKTFSEPEIHAISSFLKRHKLSRAERHAIVYHLGYRYRAHSSSQLDMRNLQIDGYYNHQKRVSSI
jgi:hypothetical protein